MRKVNSSGPPPLVYQKKAPQLISEALWHNTHSRQVSSAFCARLPPGSLQPAKPRHAAVVSAGPEYLASIRLFVVGSDVLFVVDKWPREPLARGARPASTRGCYSRSHLVSDPATPSFDTFYQVLPLGYLLTHVFHGFFQHQAFRSTLA